MDWLFNLVLDGNTTLCWNSPAVALPAGGTMASGKAEQERKKTESWKSLTHCTLCTPLLQCLQNYMCPSVKAQFLLMSFHVISA